MKVFPSAVESVVPLASDVLTPSALALAKLIGCEIFTFPVAFCPRSSSPVAANSASYFSEIVCFSAYNTPSLRFSAFGSVVNLMFSEKSFAVLVIATLIVAAGANTAAHIQKPINTITIGIAIISWVLYFCQNGALASVFFLSSFFLAFLGFLLSSLSSPKLFSSNSRSASAFLTRSGLVSGFSSAFLVSVFAFSFAASSITSSSFALSRPAARKFSSVGTTGRDCKVFATGIRANIAIFIIAGSAVTTTTTFSTSFATRATNFIFTALRSIVAFFGGTITTNFLSAC